MMLKNRKIKIICAFNPINHVVAVIIQLLRKKFEVIELGNCTEEISMEKINGASALVVESRMMGSRGGIGTHELCSELIEKIRASDKSLPIFVLFHGEATIKNKFLASGATGVFDPLGGVLRLKLAITHFARRNRQ